MNFLLQVRDLSIDYAPSGALRCQAVRGVSFDVAPGEIVGLMGGSGCGKTSIAMALLGLLPEKTTEISGSILFRGADIRAMSEDQLREIRGAGISIVFQEPEIALNPVMRVGDQVAEVIHAHRDWSWSRCRDEAKSVLDQVGLGGSTRLVRAYPHQLSGGQRQRVVLAQALACEPTLIIADEPTASLDACSQAEFLTQLRQLNKERGTSILLISHSPEVQATLTHRLLVMEEGQIVEQGDFMSLYRQAVHPTTKAMLRTAGAPTGRTPNPRLRQIA